MMQPKWSLILTLRNNFGPEHYSMALDADEIVTFGERFVDDIRDQPPYGLGPTFETVVEALKVRQLRRDILEGESRRLGKKLAEHMEDKEGWHGEDRRERIKAAAT